MDVVPEEVPKKKPILLIGILLVLLVTGAAFAFTRFRKPQTQNTTEMLMGKSLHGSFQLTNIVPNGKTTLPEKIEFTFSDDVSPVEFEKFFEIIPPTKGKFTTGFDNSVVVFTPDQPFARGAHILTHIGAGLHSLNHKTLLSPEIHTFDTELADSEVKFVTDQFIGRVMSFPSDTGFHISVKKASNLSQVQVTLYRSTQANLLNYLLYKSTTIRENGSSYTYTTDDYLTNFSPHSPKQEIEKFDVKDSEFAKDFSLHSGIYYLEAKAQDGLPVGSVFLVVSKYGITVNQDDQRLFATTFEYGTSKAISDVPSYVGAYNLEAVPTQLSTHVFTGIDEGMRLSDKRVDALIATINNETAFAPLRLPQSMASILSSDNLEKRYQIFVYTDRPIYQPDDTIYFHGTVRIDSDSLYKLPPAGTQVRVWSYDSDTPWVDIVTTVDVHGNFWGQFKAPKTLASQNVSANRYITANVYTGKKDQYGGFYTNFDVIPYTKPTFLISAKSEKSEYFSGDQLRFTVDGKKLDEKPLAGEAVKYTVYTKQFYEMEKAVYNTNFNVISQGGMCGGGDFSEYYGEEVMKSELRLDENGKGTVPVTLDAKYDQSQEVVVVFEKTDDAGNVISSAATTVMHASDTSVFFPPSQRSYLPGQKVEIPVYAEKLSGEKLAGGQISFSVATRSYNGNTETENVFATGSNATNGEGQTVFSFTIPKDFKPQSFILTASYKDGSGRVSKNSSYFYVSDPTDSFYSRLSSRWINDAAVTYLKMYVPKNSYKVGDTVQMTVVSPKEIDASFTLERGRIYEPKIVHLKAGANVVEFLVSTELSPSITPTFSFFADGTYHNEGLSINVPAMHRLLTVAVTTEKEKYAPSDTATLKVHITDANGSPVKAAFSLGVVDKAIYALRKNASPPIHSAFYFFRRRSTNSSSSLTWVGTLEWGGGGGGGGGGDGMGTRPVDTLYWNPNLETDENGDATIAVPIKNVEAAWRAQVIATTDRTDVGQSTVDFTSL